MTILTIHIATLWAGESNPPSDPDQNLIEQRVAELYDFLPTPLRVTVDDQRLTIHCPSPTQAQVEQSENLALQAGRHAAAGRCERAIKLFQRAARLNPANNYIYRDLGMAHQQLGKFIAARDYFVLALRLAPADVGTMIAGASLALHGFGNVAMAEAMARDACALQPYNPLAVNALAAALVHAERWDEAVPLFEWLVGHCPTMPHPYFALATQAEEQGDAEAALDWLERLFAHAEKMGDVRMDEVFEHARELKHSLQLSRAGRG